MSKGEDVQAYTRLLRYQNKRYGLTIRDFIIYLIGLVIIFGGTVWLSSRMTGTAATIFFILAGIYALVLSITFFDFIFGFGFFKNNQTIYSAVILLISVIIVVASSALGSFIFEEDENLNTLSAIVLVLYLVESIIISYFIFTTTPKRQGREEMIERLDEIRNDIDKIPISDLESTNAANRAIRWLEFQQRDDGIWGNENPLYETAEVLQTFVQLKDGLKHSWKRVQGGQEEVRNVEQTYFRVMEALEIAAIESNYEMLVPVLSVSQINPEFVNLDMEAFVDFVELLNTLTEWEFVQNLENYTEGTSTNNDIPTIFPMSKIYYLKGDLGIAQKCADVFSQTFDILIRRAATRFTIQGEKQISNLLLGKMYNSLVLMLRGVSKISESNIFSEFGIEDEFGSTDSTNDSMELPSLELPDMDSFDLPSVDMDPSPSGSETTDRIKIDISMANIRNFLRNRQQLDGSWNGRIDTTAECLLAVSDQESPESTFIKMGVHYLLALQEKNGSWQNDIVLTSIVLRTLLKINQSIGLGVF